MQSGCDRLGARRQRKFGQEERSLAIVDVVDRTAQQAVAKVLGSGSKDVADATRTVVSDLDRIEFTSAPGDSKVPSLPDLPLPRTLSKLSDDAISRLKLGRFVWGDATAEKAVLNRGRAAVMRARVAIDGTKDLADLSSAQMDDLMAHIAAKAVVEVRGARDLPLTVAAIGAYGRRSVGPFSSLDFAVLVGKDNLSSLKIARKVASKIVSNLKAMGETTHVRAGVRPGSYLSPGGLFGTALVGTPGDLAKAAVSPELPAVARWEMHDLRPIFSNSQTDLRTSFQTELGKALGQTGQRGAEARLMSSAIPASSRDVGSNLDVTMSIERPIATLVRSLAVRNGITGATTADRLQALVDRGTLPSHLGEDARSALIWAGNAKVEVQISRGADVGSVKLGDGERVAAQAHLLTVTRLQGFARQP